MAIIAWEIDRVELVAAYWYDPLLNLLGFDMSRVPEGSKREFVWLNMPSSLAGFAVLAAIALAGYAVYWLYRRENDVCSKAGKLLLATIRTIVLLILAIILLDPAVIYVQERTIHPTIALLRDGSRSMATADGVSDPALAKRVASATGMATEQVGVENPTRASILDKAFAKDQFEFLKGLQQKARVKISDFADEVQQRESRPSLTAEKKTAANEKDAAEAMTAPVALQADGKGTDIGLAIREGIASETPSALILFTDGQQTAPTDPRDAAREAKEKGVPIFAVGMGDSRRPRNLRVASVYARPRVWQGEPFEIEAAIIGQGMEARQLKVELVEFKLGESDAVPAPDSGTVVATQDVSITEGDSRVSAAFSHRVAQSGRYQYAVRVEPFPEEQNQDDNQMNSIVVRCLSRERIKVLVISGGPTWDYIGLEKLLLRERNMLVSCWLQTLEEGRSQQGTLPITRLPMERAELFEYDAILLLDPNPADFDEAWINLLEEFCKKHSGGVLYMAGPKYSGQFLTNERTGKITELLPVRFEDVGALEVQSLLSTNRTPWPLRVTAANADHPVLSFYSDRRENLSRWESLPGIFWSFPCEQARPTTQVLLEHTDPTLRNSFGARPMMVAGRAGAGHTLYLGFQGVWRWRQAGRQAEFFDRFWIQSIRHLAEGRSLEGQRRGVVRTDRERYEVGDRVSITAELKSTDFQPLSVPSVEGVIRAGEKEGGGRTIPVKLTPIANRPGAYEASATALAAGIQTITLKMPVGAEGPTEGGETIEAAFSVELPSIETAQVWLDKPRLVEIAEASGGKYFEIDQLSDLVAAIPDRTETVEVRSQPEHLWSLRGTLIALVSLLGLEWMLRKRFRLL